MSPRLSRAFAAATVFVASPGVGLTERPLSAMFVGANPFRNRRWREEKTRRENAHFIVTPGCGVNKVLTYQPPGRANMNQANTRFWAEQCPSPLWANVCRRVFPSVHTYVDFAGLRGEWSQLLARAVPQRRGPALHCARHGCHPSGAV